MSKPWFQINSVTYSSPNLTLQYSFGRLRGDVFGNKTITIDGFSGSISFTEDKFANIGSEVQTFTVGALGTNSSATYVDPTSITWTFGGTTSTTTNAKLTLGSTQLSSFTASSSALATFLAGLATSIDGNAKGIAATSTSTTLVVSAPNTGNLYNGTQVFLNLTKGTGTIIGTSSFGLSNSGTFSGGSTAYNLRMTIPVGGYVEEFTIPASMTASLL